MQHMRGGSSEPSNKDRKCVLAHELQNEQKTTSSCCSLHLLSCALWPAAKIARASVTRVLQHVEYRTRDLAIRPSFPPLRNSVVSLVLLCTFCTFWGSLGRMSLPATMLFCVQQRLRNQRTCLKASVPLCHIRYVKAYMRRATAFEAMEELDRAIDDWKKVHV